MIPRSGPESNRLSESFKSPYFKGQTMSIRTDNKKKIRTEPIPHGKNDFCCSSFFSSRTIPGKSAQNSVPLQYRRVKDIKNVKQVSELFFMVTLMHGQEWDDAESVGLVLHAALCGLKLCHIFPCTNGNFCKILALLSPYCHHMAHRTPNIQRAI